MLDDDKPQKKTPKSPATRDKRGRWQKGYCPNLKGRPRKEKYEDYNPSDIRDFMNTQIELNIGGQPVKMDRRAALLNKVYEGAMKGKVTCIRLLLHMTQENDAQLAELRVQYDKLVRLWILDNPDFKGLDDMPAEQRILLLSLASTLNHYFPGQYQELLKSYEDVNEEDIASFAARLSEFTRSDERRDL